VPLDVVAGRLGDRAETVLATYAHLLPHSDEVITARPRDTRREMSEKPTTPDLVELMRR
jgi:hypothetical protein